MPDEAENEAPKEVEQDASLTMEQLAERARAAWLNPLRAMGETYFRQGRAMLEGLLTSLERNEEKPRKKEK